MRRVEPFTPQHLDGLVALYAHIFGAGKAERFRRRFDWQFVRNPYGDGGVTNWIVTNDAQVVGHFGAMPVAFMIGGEPVRGGWICDFMAYKEHRTRPEIAELRANISRSSAFPISYGVSDRIARSFVDVGWQWHTLEPFLVKVLHLGALGIQLPAREPGRAGRARGLARRAAGLPRLFGHYLWQSVRRVPSARGAGVELRAGFDDGFDELWARAGEAHSVAVARDRKYLTWRYPIGGSEEARLVVLPGGDAPRAFAVLEKVRWRGLVVGLISELVFPVARVDDASRVLAFAEDLLRREGVAAMVTEGFPSSLRDVFFAHGFASIDRERANVIFFDRDRAFPPELLADVQNWLLTPGDCDRSLGYARVAWRNS